MLLDCGVKRNIIRDLTALDARVTVLPYGASREDILAENPDAVVISPGPGDPRDLGDTVDTLRGLIGEKPLFGVCLGHQLLALACGAQTYKLKYGHRGGNQPVKDVVHDEVIVTAHNHGYAVEGDTLPADARSDDDQPQRRHERRVPAPHAAGRSGAVPPRSVARPVRRARTSSRAGSTASSEPRPSSARARAAPRC